MALDYTSPVSDTNSAQSVTVLIQRSKALLMQSQRTLPRPKCAKKPLAGQCNDYQLVRVLCRYARLENPYDRVWTLGLESDIYNAMAGVYQIR